MLVAQDGRPDMPAPRHDDNNNPSGNYLILRGAQADIVLAHFRRGSLRVRAGDSVVVGQWLARPGPPGFPMGGAPLPMRFRGRFLVRNSLVRVPRHPFDAPDAGLATQLAPATQ